MSTNRIRSRKGEHTAGTFSVLYSVDMGYEFHPSRQVANKGSTELEVGHSPPSGGEIKNAWSRISSSPYIFMAPCMETTVPHLRVSPLEFRNQPHHTKLDTPHYSLSLRNMQHVTDVYSNG
jgi:hypothetical protein